MRIAWSTGLGLASVLLAPAVQTQEARLVSSVIGWVEIQSKPRPNGRSWQVVQAPTATLAELESHVTALGPGDVPHPPHRHAAEEVLLVKEGTLEVTIEGVAKRIGPGGFAFLAANDLHGWRNVGETRALYFVIQWKPRSS